MAPTARRRCRAPPLPTPPPVGCRPRWPSPLRWPGGPARGVARISTCRWPTASCGCCRSRSTSSWRWAATSAPGHDVLSGRYACYATYGTADGKWVAVGAIEAKFFANLCAALGCSELAASQFDDDAQPAIRAAFAAAFATRDRDAVDRGAGGGGHLRRPGPRRGRGAVVRAVRRPWRAWARPTHPSQGAFSPAGAPAGRYGRDPTGW